MASGIRRMDSNRTQSLLAADDPSPVGIINPNGTSSFLLIGDHAGNAVPEALGTLGIDAGERVRHIAWDIGVFDLGQLMAQAIDAPFIHQRYSRLVIDCNRAAGAADSTPEVSDGTRVSGNAGLNDADRAARLAEIAEPYQRTIGEALAARDAAGRETVLVALHSFTPEMRGVARPWEVGVLHDGGDASYARAVLAALRARGDFIVGDNEPYRMDSIDYTIPRHAYPERRPYVEIEIRQDLLGAAGGPEFWCGVMREVLVAASG